MKKQVFPLVEKKILRWFLIMTLIQLAIVLTFIYLFCSARTRETDEITQAIITVEDVFYITTPTREPWLTIYADSERYIITNGSGRSSFTSREIYESISVGDTLALSFYETHTFLGKTNLVVEARAAVDIYRTYDEYIDSKKGTTTAIAIMFLIAEFIFAGVVIVSVWLHRKIIRGIMRRFQYCKRKNNCP